ncbi:MAG TPA: pyridoxine 5'-phosphate synthase [Spirochaetota bacterium]|nr:pyridoxine 5'-phosphate synthase [Spirochaetota bacterium]HPN83386.1 pyridoxine 5'-phosphate synthase [Spirochaetota bacterium]
MKSILGVNIDHVATVREARKGPMPEIVTAAGIAEQSGAHGITIHLRQDRRHIQDRDLAILKQVVHSKLNLEMSITEEIVLIALATVPDQATLVPENRQEVTTEGGLDVAGQIGRVREVTQRLASAGTLVSHFIDPELRQIDAAREAGARYIELHTGAYANARWAEKIVQYRKLLDSATYASSIGLGVNAGHGLDYHNVQPIAAIPEVEELNIGHSIIGRAIFAGLAVAVREMADLIETAGESREWPWTV